MLEMPIEITAFLRRLKTDEKFEQNYTNKLELTLARIEVRSKIVNSLDFS